MQSLSATIEAILFATAEQYRIEVLATLTNTDTEHIEEALVLLADSLLDRGVMLVREGDKVTLATRPEYASLLETIRKEELSHELSKASAETLAVICYHPGATKADIELIRGVNASYSLRALSMRGLIESKGNGRNVTYHPTIEVLQHYGIASASELPNYAETKQKIDTLLTTQSNES